MGYSIPASNGQGTEIGEYRAANNAMPELDSPEVFGLHPNADLTFRTKEVNSLLDALSETQPKTGGGGGGQSREDVVYEKASELLERLPVDYMEDEFKKTIVGLGGLSVPLNMFLFQEIQRLQKVIAKVRFVLTQMQGVINGEVVMTPEFQQALESIYDARVPPTWLHTPGGDEFSWLNKTLGLWFTSLMDRDKQYREWLSSGRPNSYWMTGFFNPQGFLTGMNQKAEKWALDDVVTHSEVTQYADETHVKQAPKEGVYVHGLFLDGASWSKEDGGTLVEMEPKKLYTPFARALRLGRDEAAEEGVPQLLWTVWPVRMRRVQVRCPRRSLPYFHGDPSHDDKESAALDCAGCCAALRDLNQQVGGLHARNTPLF